MTVISISGVGGAGKTTVAKLLAKRLGYRLIELNELAKKKKLYISYDEKRKSWIVSITKLKKEIKKLAKKSNIIIESLYAHEFPADFVIILRCNPNILEKRLKKKYTWPTKIRENLEAEMINLITEEAFDYNKNVFEIDTSKKTPVQTVNTIQEIISGKKEKCETRIDWLK